MERQRQRQTERETERERERRKERERELMYIYSTLNFPTLHVVCVEFATCIHEHMSHVLNWSVPQVPLLLLPASLSLLWSPEPELDTAY